MRTSYRPIGQIDGKGARDTPFGGRDSEITAWIVLWTAFAVFCALVVGAFFGARHYRDTATGARTVTLSLEQGIVLFRDAVTSTLINAHDNLSLRERDELLVGQGARAYVTLFDGSTVLLYSGSELRLEELKTSRFHDGFTRIAMHLRKGTARIVVAPSSTDTTRFQVTTQHGSMLLLEGDFGLEVSSDQTRVSSRRGTAMVARGESMIWIGGGEKALLTAGGMSPPLPVGDQLLANGDFSEGFARWEFLNVDEPGRPAEPGSRALLTQKIDGTEIVALSISRVSRLATHNETGLTQVINKDVSDCQSLQLSADVCVNEQSLSGGGYLGYEYPIMLRVRYRDDSGAQVDWSHGFFHKNPENRPTPNGQEVLQGQWVHYQVELMTVRQRPVHIISVEVLGAGHSFDGMIANVSLTGR